MKISLLLTLIIGIIVQVYYYSVLPEYVANNYGAHGQPNAWMTKDWNLTISIIIYLVNTLIFISVPLMLRKLPLKYLSFPGKEYWLSDERKNKNIPLIAEWMYFLGVMTNIFIILISHLVYMANISTPVRLNEDIFFTIVIIYVLILLMWMVLLFKKFNRTTS